MTSAAVAFGDALDVRADDIVEVQRGDPNLPSETLHIDRSVLESVLSSGAKASFQPYKRDFPRALLSAATKYVGSSRQATPDRIAEILSLYRLPLKDNTGFVPFCAAGIGFCAAMAYAELLGIAYRDGARVQTVQPLLPDIEHWYYYPTVSCQDMRLVEMGKRRWVGSGGPNRTVPRAGWIVLYAWDHPSEANHCGIVMSATAQTLHTVEFNTSGAINGNQVNGGAVVVKDRPYNAKVIRFIATDRAPRF